MGRLFLGALFLAIAGSLAIPEAQAERVLVFTKTAGFRHESIPAAVAALRGLAGRPCETDQARETGGDQR